MHTQREHLRYGNITVVHIFNPGVELVRQITHKAKDAACMVIFSLFVHGISFCLSSMRRSTEAGALENLIVIPDRSVVNYGVGNELEIYR